MGFLPMSRGVQVSAVRRVLLPAIIALLAGFLLTLLLYLYANPAEAQVTLPSGFNDKRVATMSKPIALAPTPDGRMLVTSQWGQLRVLDKNE